MSPTKNFDGFGVVADQRRGGDHVGWLRPLGMLIQVYDLQIVGLLEFPLAEAANIRHRPHRARSRTGNEECQAVARVGQRRSSLRLRANIQTYENALLVGKVPQNLLHRFRKSPHQRRQREYLIAGSELRFFHQVDHFDCIPAFKVLLADTVKIVDRAQDLSV